MVVHFRQSVAEHGVDLVCQVCPLRLCCFHPGLMIAGGSLWVRNHVYQHGPTLSESFSFSDMCADYVSCCVLGE